VLEITRAKAVTFILTKDLAKSQRFYSESLGLTFLQNDGFADVYDLGDAVLRVTEIPDYVAAAHPVLGWVVGDIKKAVNELVAKGVEMVIYEGYGQDENGIWTAPDGKAKVAWFHDPDMNLLSITQSG
jgi:catechol 2,3-dioxygenase-like lactoylglutathione lyase family enzyme